MAGATAGSLVRRELRQTEIHELGLAARGQEDVRGLDVAVHDAFLMGSIKCVGNLNADIEQRIQRERAPRHSLLERFTLEQFHYQEELPFVLLNVVNGADVGVIQRRSRPCFAAEALQRLRIFIEFLGEKLQGDAPAKLQVFGSVDHAHAAETELFDDPVVRKGLANHQMRLPLREIIGGGAERVNAWGRG
jgi:hypothetical protein